MLGLKKSSTQTLHKKTLKSAKFAVTQVILVAMLHRGFWCWDCYTSDSWSRPCINRSAVKLLRPVEAQRRNVNVSVSFGDADAAAIPERPEAGIVSSRGWRTYKYSRHVTLLALVEERVVPERAHVALPGGGGALARVYVAIEAAWIVRFWKEEIWKWCEAVTNLFYFNIVFFINILNGDR